MQAKLLLVGGRATKKEISLQLPTVLGRAEDAGVAILHPSVSRQHCELFERGGKLVLRDNNSANGTFVDQERISETELQPGDTFTVGPLTFQAEYDLAATANGSSSTSPADATAGLALDVDEEEWALDPIDEAADVEAAEVESEPAAGAETDDAAADEIEFELSDDFDGLALPLDGADRSDEPPPSVEVDESLVSDDAFPLPQDDQLDFAVGDLADEPQAAAERDEAEAARDESEYELGAPPEPSPAAEASDDDDKVRDFTDAADIFDEPSQDLFSVDDEEDDAASPADNAPAAEIAPDEDSIPDFETFDEVVETDEPADPSAVNPPTDTVSKGPSPAGSDDSAELFAIDEEADTVIPESLAVFPAESKDLPPAADGPSADRVEDSLGLDVDDEATPFGPVLDDVESGADAVDSTQADMPASLEPFEDDAPAFDLLDEPDESDELALDSLDLDDAALPLDEEKSSSESTEPPDAALDLSPADTEPEPTAESEPPVTDQPESFALPLDEDVASFALPVDEEDTVQADVAGLAESEAMSEPSAEEGIREGEELDLSDDDASAFDAPLAMSDEPSPDVEPVRGAASEDQGEDSLSLDDELFLPLDEDSTESPSAQVADEVESQDAPLAMSDEPSPDDEPVSEAASAEQSEESLSLDDELFLPLDDDSLESSSAEDAGEVKSEDARLPMSDETSPDVEPASAEQGDDALSLDDELFLPLDEDPTESPSAEEAGEVTSQDAPFTMSDEPSADVEPVSEVASTEQGDESLSRDDELFLPLDEDSTESPSSEVADEVEASDVPAEVEPAAAAPESPPADDSFDVTSLWDEEPAADRTEPEPPAAASSGDEVADESAPLAFDEPSVSDELPLDFDAPADSASDEPRAEDLPALPMDETADEIESEEHSWSLDDAEPLEFSPDEPEPQASATDEVDWLSLDLDESPATEEPAAEADVAPPSFAEPAAGREEVAEDDAEELSFDEKELSFEEIEPSTGETSDRPSEPAIADELSDELSIDDLLPATSEAEDADAESFDEPAAESPSPLADKLDIESPAPVPSGEADDASEAFDPEAFLLDDSDAGEAPAWSPPTDETDESEISPIAADDDDEVPGFQLDDELPGFDVDDSAPDFQLEDESAPAGAESERTPEGEPEWSQTSASLPDDTETASTDEKSTKSRGWFARREKPSKPPAKEESAKSKGEPAPSKSTWWPFGQKRKQQRDQEAAEADAFLKKALGGAESTSPEDEPPLEFDDATDELAFEPSDAPADELPPNEEARFAPPSDLEMEQPSVSDDLQFEEEVELSFEDTADDKTIDVEFDLPIEADTSGQEVPSAAAKPNPSETSSTDKPARRGWWPFGKKQSPPAAEAAKSPAPIDDDLPISDDDSLAFDEVPESDPLGGMTEDAPSVDLDAEEIVQFELEDDVEDEVPSFESDDEEEAPRFALDDDADASLDVDESAEIEFSLDDEPDAVPRFAQPNPPRSEQKHPEADDDWNEFLKGFDQ